MIDPFQTDQAGGIHNGLGSHHSDSAERSYDGGWRAGMPCLASATQNHALLVRDLINQIKESKDPGYCQRVTANDGALGELHLRYF